MATINIGGLATGLDTNKIVDQLVKLEHRGVDLLLVEQGSARDKQSALQIFNGKVLAFLTAVDKLRTPGDVLVRKATSSDPAVLGATASSGAVAGSTSVTVTSLARGAIATSANGKASAAATIAGGTGSFVFRVGTGAAQTVAMDATTTLQGLATAINTLDAGATATVINVGTTAAPDYRLRLATTGTGDSNVLTIVSDDTTLGVGVTQQAANAVLTVSGFADPITRETNSVNDLIPGVTLDLTGTGGPVTVAVTTDGDGVVANVQSAVKAFNDLVAYVAAQSVVSQDGSSSDREVTTGPLAFDGTVRAVLDGVHRAISDAVPGLSGQYTLLAQVGITTNSDGTLAFDTGKLASALATDDGAVGALFGGAGTTAGAADRLHDYLAGITQIGGLIAGRSDAIGQQLNTLAEQIDAGERHVSQFEDNLRATFTSLELLVNGLQSQGALLLSALGRTSN
jgi:flagellar hook-associated protein 2